MIRLKDILQEAGVTPIPKNKYVELDKNQLKQYAQDILDIITSSYKSKGGNPAIGSPNDITGGDFSVWHAADIDKDPQIDTAIGIKKKPAGFKMTAMGQDGTPAAKKSLITKAAQLLHTRGFYAELSPDLAQKFHLQPIKDENVIKSVIGKDDIEFTGNGLYTRSIDSVTRTKVLVGEPYVTEAYKPMSRSKVMKLKRARKKAKSAKKRMQLRKARIKYKKKKSVIRRKSQQRKRKLGKRIKAAAKKRNL
jgi:hypothetical protein